MNDLREILRTQRTRAKRTRDQVGAAVGLSGASIAAFEQGRMIPQPDTAERLDAHFKTGDQIQRATTEARNDARPIWLRPWTEQEQRATMLRCFEHSLIPGLLQTEAYTRALLASGRLPEDVIERTTQVRRERQAATINRPNPPMLSALICEVALSYGPADVMKEQLEHLVELSRRPQVQILVVPRAAGLHPGLQGAFVLATLPARGRAVYLDDQLRGRSVTDGADVDELERSWEIVRGLALPVSLSQDLIMKVVNNHD
ncbi:helix-turn-helix transcriptional regulator [Micromonospora sp. WMMD1102]|uniref:helix-turn-helix domain-containing protein n=1 Tax=Micromonospora sp. WMMD1102 TaxID=3016105 RepID=UPI0024155AF4|nr:helix-turn-helix transcriptional regulator [Micromonospora sp. WMMD1102]MDG4788255.1 helix-turn-helix transcriptional regulator [Micromonospora sp. WMMD1102]